MAGRYDHYERLKLDFPSDRVLRITFDNPNSSNSIDAATHKELVSIWRDIDSDTSVNAVIVTGAGKAFSAGGDFSLVKSVIEDGLLPGNWTVLN